MDYNNSFIIPMSSPDITDLERQAVMDVLQTTSLSMGARILAFEAAFREFTGAKHAIAVNSGTAGLHLCVRAAGIQAGDCVITTPFSFVSSTNAFLYENAIPVYVDADPQTGNIDPKMVEQAAQDLLKGGSSAQRWLPRKGAEGKGILKAILSVDVFGQPADFDPLRASADRYGLKLINDSCESLGAVYKNTQAGRLGDYGVFAFYPNKQITTGEGGIIITDDDQAARIMRALRNQGRVPGDTWLDHSLLGYNYRLDEFSAALGAAQMLRLEELLQKRSRVAEWYNRYLAEVNEVEVPYVSSTTSRVSWFVYVVRVSPHFDRTNVIRSLAERGIPSRPYFSPIHLQPFMVERFGFREGDYPVTEDLGKRGLALPFSGLMTEEQVITVCSTLKDILIPR
ncbi:MAG: DegT/DnrJ/EryC1/StrS family aminotransferase [Chloroflexi bacterium]|nr:DegT/DnrJ/EryC1/StrS family aminotransferase [Chloroflexota bacterium]